MQEDTAAGRSAARLIRGAGATVLLLGMWCAPVSAASGVDALCDTTTNSALDVHIPPLEIDIELTERNVPFKQMERTTAERGHVIELVKPH